MPKREKRKFGRLALWIARIALGAAFIIVWVWLYNLILGWANLRTADKTGAMENSNSLYWITVVAGSVLAGAVAVLSASAILSALFAIYKAIEKALSNYSGRQIFMGIVGLTIGLGVVLIIVLIFPVISEKAAPVPIFMCIVLGFIGLMLGMRRMSEPAAKDKDSGKAAPAGIPKILDSSVLIDGRILDVAKTGFVDGPFIIPAFIIDELRRITDNTDVLKRNRGKRGIDIINAMQAEKNFEVIMSAQDYDEGDTDYKLLKLAEDLKAKIITNDYNLNKIASLKEIQVLNINELNNAIKPIALPGEKMRVKLVKEGKEAGQAVAYLEDGTMIVVENGGRNIGQEVDITITTALQTAAGRLIFGRI